MRRMWELGTGREKGRGWALGTGTVTGKGGGWAPETGTGKVRRGGWGQVRGTGRRGVEGWAQGMGRGRGREEGWAQEMGRGSWWWVWLVWPDAGSGGPEGCSCLCRCSALTTDLHTGDSLLV